MFKTKLRPTGLVLKSLFGRPNVVRPLVVPQRELFQSVSKFTNAVQNKAQMEKLRLSMEDKGFNEGKMLQYIRLMNQNSPREAAQYIEKGWASKKMPVNEAMVREYFKAIGAMGKFDSVNIGALMALLNKSNTTGAPINQSDVLQMMNQGGGIGAFRSSSGSSPDDPIYVTQMPGDKESLGHTFVKFLFKFLGVFLFVSLASAMLEEKGGTGGGGMGKMLGLKNNIVHEAEKSDKSFDDVVGIDEAKGELEEIVQYLQNPKQFTRLGGKLPKGVLLTGPPGTGKTLLARAIAGEANVPFFYSSGSEFEEMYVGVGAARVRTLFEAAKAKSPCIIFIDEIDAIGGKRNEKDQSAMKMTLNQLLVEMDGFEQNTGVLIIAATNFPESLDQALVRPGRLDKHIDVPVPDIGGRKAILDLYCSKVPTGPDVDMEQLARGTPGFSGAELFNLVNQAAIKASVDGMKHVGMGAFEHAKDKLMMGVERKSAIISEDTMRCTAFHEAGHALVALKTDGTDPIHKATIMPRGRALGMVMQLPDGDQTSMSRKQMLARLDVCMGGRVAEEIIFGEDNVTSGASSDIQQATRLAKAMVTKYGLSTKVGVVFLDEKMGGETMKNVDEEVKKLLEDSYARATKVLSTHKKELELIANGLMEYESLSGSELVDLTKGKQPSKTLRSQKPSREPMVIPLSKAKHAEKKAKEAAAASSGGIFGFLSGTGSDASTQAPNNSGSAASSRRPPTAQQRVKVEPEQVPTAGKKAGLAVKPTGEAGKGGPPAATK